MSLISILAIVIVLMTSGIVAVPVFNQAFVESLPSSSVKTSTDDDAAKKAIKDAANTKGTMIMHSDDWQAEWCKARPFNLTVRHRNCLPVTIQNNYCYGQCNSIYIPDQAYPLEGCAVCYPKKTSYITVRFICPFDPIKKLRHRKVELIHSCQCNQRTCH